MRKMKANMCLLLLSAITLLGSSCSKHKDEKVKAPIRVKTELASSQSHGPGQQSYVGIIEENEGTAVSFTTMGVVKRVLVHEGQAVGRGQLIAVMDDTQARNVLAGAEAQMSQANDALQRYQMLHDNGSLPEVQWVEIQSKVAQAKSQLAVAKKNLADCRLIAPVSGIIGKKMVGAGETAMPSQAVVTILDIHTVKVKVSIPEKEMGEIHAHTPSTIEVEAVQKQVSGGRIEKGVQADALTHTYDVRIHVANPDRKLMPGMVATVTLGNAHGPAYTRYTTLPVTCVQRQSNGTLFVWTVANDSTVHRTPVTVGSTTGNRLTITSGVGQDDRVVTEGYQKLSEGTSVIY